MIRHGRMTLSAAVAAGTVLTLCQAGTAQDMRKASLTPTDSKATEQTRALYVNLSQIAKKSILFGHHNSTIHGVGWKGGADPIRSDVNTACGSLPAVYGWDMSNLEHFRSHDGQPLIPIRIREAHQRGGINTISWHMRNPVTGESYKDTTPAVRSILPGGKKHEHYKKELDGFAKFIRSLKDADGTSIPIIFRPFHEHTGTWFWWSKGKCKEKEYANLWRFTVEYLRDQKELHNLLYAYSPAKNPKGDKSVYLWGYPGDDYVDILGYDHYCQDVNEALPALRLVVGLANERGKVSAFTETGVPKGMTHAKPGNYYTDKLLTPLKQDKQARGIAYVLLWRNADEDHFWIPYGKGGLMQDFRTFAADPMIVFENDLRDMYNLQVEKKDFEQGTSR